MISNNSKIIIFYYSEFLFESSFIAIVCMLITADYRLNAACSIVRWVVSRQNGELDIPMEDSDSTCDETENNADGSTSRPASRAASRSASRPASRPTSTTPTADNVPSELVLYI